MRINITKVKVKYNDRVVGYLEELNNRCFFEYDDEWLKNGFNISPFSLPLKKQTFENKNDKFNGLFGVFNDSLPDGWGTLLVIRMLMANHIDYNKITNMTKLSLISSSGLGGLEYEPCQAKEANSNNDIKFDDLNNKIQNILNDDYSNNNLDEIYELGGSSGGARPKAHIKINNDYWIVKFPMQHDKLDVGLNEYKANELARLCGINVPDFKLFKSKKCKGYFGSKRFDRINDRKVHVISLSGLLEVSHRDSNLDYSTLFSAIENVSCRPKEDKVEAYKRMCFNVLYGNRDDHAKNWSFIYDENLGGYVLSPFYDITKTHNQFRAMLVFDKEEPTQQDLLNDARIIGIDSKTATSIIDKILKVI